MATKAERFRYQVERSGAPRPKSPRPEAGTSRVRRNMSLGKKAVYAFEESLVPKTPSRKASRKSKHRQKAGTALHPKLERRRR